MAKHGTNTHPQACEMIAMLPKGADDFRAYLRRVADTKLLLHFVMRGLNGCSVADESIAEITEIIEDLDCAINRAGIHYSRAVRAGIETGIRARAAATDNQFQRFISKTIEPKRHRRGADNGQGGNK